MTYRDPADDEPELPRDERRWDSGSQAVPGSANPEGPPAPFRLPTTIPVPAEVRRSHRTGLALSVAIHALIIGMLLIPVLLSPEARALLSEGAGGPGAAGGGGGGFGIREALRYIRVAPAPAASAPTPAEVEQRATPPTPAPTPEPVQPTPTETPPPDSGAPSAGSTEGGGGAGSQGAGPGVGGGIGSGAGTGTGTADGPGTGGGTGEDYPPQPLEVFLPPSPIPSKLKGRITLPVTFDVDSLGRVLRVDFANTPDRGYNKRLREIFARMRFRPAVTPDGRPIRKSVTLTYQF